MYIKYELYSIEGSEDLFRVSCEDLEVTFHDNLLPLLLIQALSPGVFLMRDSSHLPSIEAHDQ